MTSVNDNVIVTSVQELRDILQACIVREYEGQINIQLYERGEFEVSEPIYYSNEYNKIRLGPKK